MNKVQEPVLNRPEPVFYDNSGQRWKICMAVLSAFAFIVVLSVSLFVASLFHNPKFPSLKIDERKLLQQDERNDQQGLEGALVKTAYTEDPQNRPAASTDEIPAAGARVAAGSTKTPMIFGFYVPWDENSLKSLHANAKHLTHILAEWLILKDGAGDLQDHTEKKVVDWAASERLPILAEVTNFRDDQWRREELHQVLSHPLARRLLAKNIVSRVRRYNLAGVNIDFEQVPMADRDRLTAFVRDLHNSLKPAGLLLTEDLPTDDPNLAAYNMRALTRLNDYVIPMAYDEHFAAGAPGPVASMPWVRNQMREVLKMFPPEKTVLGLGNFGYDWTLGSKRAAVEVGFSDVISKADQYHGAIDWHPGLRNSSLHYSKNGAEHEIWFLDAVTALNSVLEAHDRGFAGVSFWRLGAEDPAVWSIFGNKSWPADDFALNSLAHLDAIEGVRQYGRGEAIHILETKRPGWRKVWRDPTGFDETFEHLPSGDVVEGLDPSEGKIVAVTFDDGPDPRYTPRILDILKAKHVPATFFVVGEQAERSPDLIRRIYADGHDIGNHTYSHINELSVSEARLELELNLTQRIVEHLIGHSTTLFRSPYNSDSDPSSSAGIESVLRPQRVGYITIGERVDPRDWEAKSAGEILKVVIREKNLGKIILLHDGGGNREATIQALPTMIDRLRAQGYRLVSLEDLFGRSRNEFMPPTSLSERSWAAVEGALLVFRERLVTAVKIVFIAAIAITLLRTLIYCALGLVQRRRARRQEFDPAFKPPVSVIIAAHNEERVIYRTVAALLESDYPEFEVIVVDDGSTDETREILRSEFGEESSVRILTQSKSGKAAALNRAIKEAKHEILVTLDADTLFCPSAIGKLVRHFSDPKVAAVSGNVKVGNAKNWIARFQSIEYVCGFNLDRRALDMLNAVSVVPGAAGAWRRSAVVESNGHSLDTVAEDTDLTLTLRRQRKVIRYDEDAIAYTEVPETLAALVRQRLRWTFGTLQSVWKHRDTTFVPRYGTMAYVTIPNIWMQQLMAAGISPVAEIALLLAFIGGNAKAALVYNAALFALDLLAGVLAYALERENPLNLSLIIFQRILYPRLMLYVVCKSFLFAAGGRTIGWGVHTRNASVRIVQPRDSRRVWETVG
jgi:cellulose synthase/poly-beta-1,6-N-acetylglucosamine synthase-like glycosyltransferase/peptidoglycan/xylan/chitin deacetylase (PgdA/CDA1 family)/spore germination protein YaaH